MAKIFLQKIYDFMDSHNIACAHLRESEYQMSFQAAKTLVRLNDERLIKYTLEKINGHSYYDIIVAYKNATRKERREIPNFRDTYLLVMKNIRLQKQIEENKEIILNSESRLTN